MGGLGGGQDALLRCRRCRAPPSAMYALFSCVEARHGSVDGYLDSIGVDATLRARCASALTDDADG